MRTYCCHFVNGLWPSNDVSAIGDEPTIEVNMTWKLPGMSTQNVFQAVPNSSDLIRQLSYGKCRGNVAKIWQYSEPKSLSNVRWGDQKTPRRADCCSPDGLKLKNYSATHMFPKSRVNPCTVFWKSWSAPATSWGILTKLNGSKSRGNRRSWPRFPLRGIWNLSTPCCGLYLGSLVPLGNRDLAIWYTRQNWVCWSGNERCEDN